MDETINDLFQFNQISSFKHATMLNFLKEIFYQLHSYPTQIINLCSCVKMAPCLKVIVFTFEWCLPINLVLC